MKVNISIRPREDIQYDVSLPVPIIVSPRADKTVNATQAQILETFAHIDKHEPLIIVDNGGPPAWAERVARTLKNHGYSDVTVDQDYDYHYFDQPCDLFADPKKPYLFFDASAVKPAIKSFLEFYKSQTWNIDEPQTGVTGHYHRGPMLWTQVQMKSDLRNSRNPELMNRLQSLIPDMHGLLHRVTSEHGVDLSDFVNRVTLRLVDYVWTDKMNSALDSHIDGSLITAVLHNDEPGLHVRDYLDDTYTFANSKAIDVGDQLIGDQGVLFPGNTFCEETRMWAPACWHGVQLDDSTARRTSFLVRLESVDFIPG